MEAQVREVVDKYSCDLAAASKMIKEEAKTLSDADLISIIFGLSADDSRQWLHQLGGLRKVVEHSPLGGAVGEFCARLLKERMVSGEVLEDPDAVRFYLSSKLRDRKAEVFACVWLDNRHRVINYEELFFGTINSASVHPREVVRGAIKHNAAAVILAHNHPSGIAEPSQSDERITQRLKESLSLIDVRVLDHFVVGETIISFAERGLL